MRRASDAKGLVPQALFDALRRHLLAKKQSRNPGLSKSQTVQTNAVVGDTPLDFAAMAAPSKRARKIRSADEFDTRRLREALKTLRTGRIPLTSWTLDQIFTARDSQLRGQFQLPARLAESMRTDDALAVAFENRLAPQRCIPVEMVPVKGARGLSIAGEAEALFGQAGVGISQDTIASIHACLANHDVAFATCTATPRADGSRVDVEVHSFPIEYVRWDPFFRYFKAKVDPATIMPGDMPDPGDTDALNEYGPIGGFEVPIVHGDGRWVVFQRFEIDPFKHAPLLSAAVVWARHAYAVRDWAKGSVAHGSAKVLGSLPAGMALQTTNPGGSSVLTPEATALVDALQSFATSDSPVAIAPAGADVDFITNNSTAWQVWAELILNTERAAARIYLGTDGTLGSTGGGPGVDIATLFGVATTKVEGDLKCIERGILTGVIEPWCAMNFGDSTLAPTRRYMVPDADADAARASIATRKTAFFADIEKARDLGFDVTQKYVDATAAAYDIPSPSLNAAAEKGPSTSLTTKEVAGIVITVNEARASASLGPLMLADGVTPDPRGTMTIGEFNSGIIAKADVATTPASGAPPAALRAV